MIVVFELIRCLVMVMDVSSLHRTIVFFLSPLLIFFYVVEYSSAIVMKNNFFSFLTIPLKSLYHNKAILVPSLGDVFFFFFSCEKMTQPMTKISPRKKSLSLFLVFFFFYSTVEISSVHTRLWCRERWYLILSLKLLDPTSDSVVCSPHVCVQRWFMSSNAWLYWPF